MIKEVKFFTCFILYLLFSSLICGCSRSTSMKMFGNSPDKKPVVGPIPYSCVPGQPPGVSDLRRLNRREYMSTISQLFPSIDPALYSMFMETIPADSISNVQVFDTLDSSISSDHIQ